jgi:hypothetical protein
MEENQNTEQVQLPNSTTILVLGICSIATCWCTGLVGLGLGITTLVMSKKSNQAYKDYPGSYTESSYNNMKAGKICAIIGVSLSGLALLYFAIYLLIFGMVFSAAANGMNNGMYY